MLTITDVILELDLIIARCAATENKAGYFATLYKRMTIAVRLGIRNNAFEDAKRMEQLDLLFAKRYIDAYDAYMNNKPCTTSWKFAFDCCRNDDLTVIQHLILGINTHINLDLAIAAALTCPGNTIDTLEKDFYKINTIINSLVDDVQESLCRIWLPMRMLTKIANGRQEAVLNFSIDKAREASWANALLLAAMTSDQQQRYIQQMDATVLQIGKGIENPGMVASAITRAIRATEFENVARTINVIDTTVV